MELLTERIEKVALPILEAMNLELVDMNISRHRNDLTIRILADKKEGGITIKQCADLNRSIGDALEAADAISGHYILEVSSPGLDRPLKTYKDFRRVVGRDVRFYLSEPVENKIEYAGVVKSVDEEHVVVGLSENEITIPITRINKAVQII